MDIWWQPIAKPWRSAAPECINCGAHGAAGQAPPQAPVAIVHAANLVQTHPNPCCQRLHPISCAQVWTWYTLVRTGTQQTHSTPPILRGMSHQARRPVPSPQRQCTAQAVDVHRAPRGRAAPNTLPKGHRQAHQVLIGLRWSTMTTIRVGDSFK